MKCDRCKGFMYHGFLAGPIRIYVVQKCVNCGEILDEVIASNRALPLNARVRRKPPLQTEGGLEQEFTWGAHKPVKGLLRR
ncbi:MAG: hypothetical protein L0Y56_21920 [Nitrospira sp.]|nr:hypothetical protein [Nitrospira sp.]